MPIQWITREEARQVGEVEEQVLLEQTPACYPEFGEFLKRELERAGGSLYFKGVSGMVYRLGRLQSREAGGLHGIEICVRLSSAGQTLGADSVDLDLWPLMEWIIDGVGGEWSAEALEKVGAVYRIPGAPAKG